MEKILLVDDEDFFRERLNQAFIRRGYTTCTARCYDEAMSVIEQEHPAMAVIDLKMSGKSGLSLIKDALAIAPELRIVVLTGYGSIATATEAIRLGAVAYLAKPADLDEILKAFSDDNQQQEYPEEEILPPSLARVEWEHIQRVLADCDNNISCASKMLGIHRRTLQRKLYKYAPK
ncbi:CheY-like receiver and a Fis-type HTH domain-containing response regulator [Desulfocapsa sulfexigens DSM 10523]|uniref:CheY-like receiver and a Fis-type HTH domain-containing response regulator n=1 Tax=Desulfocapsa sulfexigens (strain DSM 10523 / SB164P1) TaxID=1167006 RepID=M1P178_DESSD|nr:response regulator [Desulfocapsa sulfexigens]AGF77283.1 CheY-like receiver and a Fis-type HTH domain-containing response regulator [Desulfocapsa sulfexigens DSM 10523]